MPAWSVASRGWKRAEPAHCGPRLAIYHCMKTQLVALTTLALALGCGQKQADGTYHVNDPSPTVKADTEKVRQNAAKAGDEIKKDAKELGSKIDSATEKARRSEAGERIANGAKETAQGIK